MRDIGLALRTGYFNTLNGLTVGGLAIPAFDYAAPHPEATPYIILGEMMAVAGNTKDSFGQEVTVDMMIYTNYAGDFGGRKLADGITDAALQVLIPTPGKSGVSAAGFHVISAKLLGTSDMFGRHAGGTTYGRRITIEHIVYEN